MSLHRPHVGSIPARQLLGSGTAELPSGPSHRRESGSGRVRAIAGSAVAAGALAGVAGQVAPAAAYAAPVTESQDAAVAPFGLVDLPAEVAAPLRQAEQAVAQLEQAWNEMQQNGALAPPALSRPTAVVPVGGQISSSYGTRWGAFHNGVDIADTIGTPIRSALGGTVIEAGPAAGFGLWVRVAQDDGTTAVYGHINDYNVAVGDRVDAGDVIASVGNRGQSTGPHLHLEIWDTEGYKIDPLAWLSANGAAMEQDWGPRM